MGSPTLNDIKLFFEDLLTNRRNLLLSVSSGVIYEKRFSAIHAELVSLPAQLVRERPLAEELSDADVNHDGYGRFIWYVCEAYRSLPRLSEALRKKSEEIQRTFVPALDELTAPYPDEAARAKDRRPALKNLAEALQSFPVAEQGSLFEVASSFLDSGEEIGQLLGQRAVATQEEQSKGDRRAAGRLRNTAIGLIRRFRAILADEMVVEKDLPKDLDAKIFSYFDLLVSIRESGSDEPTPAPPKEEKKTTPPEGNAA